MIRIPPWTFSILITLIIIGHFSPLCKLISSNPVKCHWPLAGYCIGTYTRADLGSVVKNVAVDVCVVF